MASLHRTLEQELFALLRGASFECPVCGEFVFHRADRTIGCPECGALFGLQVAVPERLADASTG